MEFSVNGNNYKIVYNKKFVTGIYVCIYRNDQVFDQLGIKHYDDLSNNCKKKFKDKDHYFSSFLEDTKQAIIKHEGDQNEKINAK